MALGLYSLLSHLYDTSLPIGHQSHFGHTDDYFGHWKFNERVPRYFFMHCCPKELDRKCFNLSEIQETFLTAPLSLFIKI